MWISIYRALIVLESTDVALTVNDWSHKAFSYWSTTAVTATQLIDRLSTTSIPLICTHIGDCDRSIIVSSFTVIDDAAAATATATTATVAEVGYRQNPPATKPPSRNPVQSKLLSFHCECRDRDRSIVHDVFYVRYVAQKNHDICHILHTLQFNKNTKHKFRRLYYYILLPVCLWRTKWPFMTSFCVGILKIHSLWSLWELLHAIRNLTL